MNRIILTLMITSFLSMTAIAAERTLFIVDFSNSMTENLDGARKIDHVLSTMSEILPKIQPNEYVGLRVYGQRRGFTLMDMCKASRLLVPITQGSAKNIENALFNANPRGMTPITYSLKQAVAYDFLDYHGQKHIILLSDGGENCDESPCKYIMELMQTRRDIKIDVIAYNVGNQEDIDQLRCVAMVTKGQFHTVNTAAELVDSLNNSFGVEKEVEGVILK